MSANKRATIKRNNPLDNLFGKQEAATEKLETTNQAVTTDAETKEPESISEPVATDTQADDVSYHKTSLLVTEEQLFWLEEKCLQARRGGRTLHKAELIRALIDVARNSGVDLSKIKDVEDLTGKLSEAIKNQ